MVVQGFHNLYRSRWVCGIVTIPDGRVVAHRMLFNSGPTDWSAVLRTTCYGPVQPRTILARLAKDKFGVLPKIENIKHVITHSDAKYEYTDPEPRPAWDYHYDSHYMAKIEVLVYKISYPEMVKFYIKHHDIDIVVMPFKKILSDISSGAWLEYNVTVFNLLNEMCKKEFAA